MLDFECKSSRFCDGTLNALQRHFMRIPERKIADARLQPSLSVTRRKIEVLDPPTKAASAALMRDETGIARSLPLRN
jgi:hypothetical protein